MSPRANGRLASGAMSEAAFQGAVVGLARFYGWRVFHAPDNRPVTPARGRAGRQRVTPGWPDLTLTRYTPAPTPQTFDTAELIFTELKAEAGVVSAAQAEYLEELGHVARLVSRLRTEAFMDATDQGAHVEVYLWRPSDWDAITERLARGRVLVPHPLGA